MYLFSSFEQSIYLELVVTALEEKGISRDNILAVPLDRRKEGAIMFDTIHRSDGLSLFDLAAVTATVGMVLGVTYGFVLHWGPVIIGLIGTVIGFAIGFLIDYLINKRKLKKESTNNKSEVILMVNCQETEVEMVIHMLWSHYAIGVAKLDRTSYK